MRTTQPPSTIWPSPTSRHTSISALRSVTSVARRRAESSEPNDLDMKSLWSDADAAQFGDDALGLRVYTSRLLGREPALVLHGGGNTSVKAMANDPLGRAT